MDESLWPARNVAEFAYCPRLFYLMEVEGIHLPSDDDICDDKRLRRVFKICKGFGEHWQYSIFFAVLRPIDRVRLQAELEEVLNLAEDQVLILDLGEDEDQARASACVLGQALKAPAQGMVVV